MRLRQSEVDAVLSALDKEYDTSRIAATQVFNTVVGLLAARESYVVGARFRQTDAATLRTGPHWDLRSAKSEAGWWTSQGLVAVIGRVYPARTPDDEIVTNAWCPDCGHALDVHAVTTKTGRGKLRCFHRGCEPCAPSWPRGRRGG